MQKTACAARYSAQRWLARAGVSLHLLPNDFPLVNKGSAVATL
ncbi:hypothetical protein VITFI_CDS2091 [Vitreoscilla filiformis]|uniref:Uncharacterized protein n=1 Tax=Vitreoscilla filiformis TaxID=63 RepID=A0A221KFZ1_VITFI|nr:hypothetical protein VITFI_CDS2091 [Vitreoscilla filiformis]